jgi:hypothetical protein
MLDSSLWQTVYQGNFEVATNGTLYVPLPPIDIPIAFEKPLIAIRTSSFNSPPKWFTAGWLSQKINTGLTVTGVDDAVLSRRRVELNKLSVFRFSQDIASTYTLSFSFPRWMKDISLAVWEYQGDIPDVTQSLERIESFLGTNSFLSLGSPDNPDSLNLN